MTTRAIWCCALALVLASCVQQQPEALEERRECPRTPPDDVQDRLVGLVGPTINIAEYNDCQRFIKYENGKAVYGGRFWIFAQPTETLPQLDPSTTRSGLIAMSAAVILAEDNYKPLEIVKGYNCLFVYRNPPTSGRVLAEMVDLNGADCSKPQDPELLEGRDLDVISRVSVIDPPPQEGDYPYVARWDWADTLQIIGIKCPPKFEDEKRKDEWCNIGPKTVPPFKRPPTFYERRGSPNISRPEKKVADIKGWYDEQLLAAVDEATGEVEPTSIKGTIVPHPDLGSYEMSKFTKDWLPVASVALDAPPVVPNPYKKKFGFTFTGAKGPFNQVQACYGPDGPADCKVPDAGKLPKCKCDDSAEEPCNTNHWFARVINTDPLPDTIYHRLCRYEMNVEIPGTARWRWLRSDEGGWFRCVNGCCELKGEG